MSLSSSKQNPPFLAAPVQQLKTGAAAVLIIIAQPEGFEKNAGFAGISSGKVPKMMIKANFFFGSLDFVRKTV